MYRVMTRTSRLSKPKLGLLVRAAMIGACAASTAASSSQLDVADRVRAGVVGSVLADSMALGVHYEYDARKIADAM